MNILQVEKYYWPKGGASRYALDLSHTLEERGHTVIPFATRNVRNLPTPYSRFFVKAFDSGEPVSLTDKMRFGMNFFYSFDAKRSMEKLLNETRIDVAHIHNIYHQLSPSILPVLKKRGIPIVMTVHDYKLISPNYLLYHHGAIHEEDAEGWYLSCIGNKCMKDNRLYSTLITAEMIFHHKIKKYYEKYVDYFLAPSTFMVEKLASHGYDRKKIIHAPVGSLFAPMPETADGQYVAYVGRLSPEKGVEVLLQAALRTPSIPYRIIGEGPEKETLMHLAQTFGLTNVTFTGYLTGDALSEAVANARCIVAPSVCYDNFPLSVIEAQAAGKVVLASALGGLPELVAEDQLFPAGDAGRLAELIKQWYSQPSSKLQELGRSLAERIRSQYDLRTQARTIEEIYHAVIEHRPYVVS